MNSDGSILSPQGQKIMNPKLKSAELLKIEKNYNNSILQLQVQKLAAIRWMSHQKLRLFAQAEEVRLERQAIYSVYFKHNKEFDDIESFLLSQNISGDKQ